MVATKTKAKPRRKNRIVEHAAPAKRVSSNGKAKKPATTKEPATTTVSITAPNMQTATFRIVGTSHYIQQRFSEKAKEQIKAKQQAGGTAKKVKTMSKKDFKQCYEDAKYKPSGTSWPNGAIPATAIKAAMISACRLTSFKMTESKQIFKILQDGFDLKDLKPLIKITKGKPEYFEQALPLPNGGGHGCSSTPHVETRLGISRQDSVRCRLDRPHANLQSVNAGGPASWHWRRAPGE